MTVVFLHGVSGSRATYGWLPETLAGHAVLRPDFRGHGSAARAPGDYLIDGYAADVADLLRSVGPAILVGHSLGGVAAWWTAQRHPELVRGAFLEDPPLYMGEPAEHERNPGIPQFRILRETVSRWQAGGMDADGAVARLAAARYAPDPTRMQGEVLTEEATAARAYALLHVDPAVLDTVLDGSLLAATDTVSAVRVPVFVLAADDALGAAFPTSHETRLAWTHPAVDVVRVAGAGHSIHDERAHRAEYLERVTAFIASHDEP